MATYGFRARNGYNEVQLDSEYRNFSLRDKGIGYATGTSVHNSYKFATVVMPYSIGMIAFRCARPCTLASVYQSGNNLVANFLVYTQATSGEAVYWYLFDEPNYGQVYPANNKFAMRLKNAAGVVTHDSRTDYMKFSDFVSGTMSNVPSTPTSSANPVYQFYNYPGTVPAVVQGVTCSSQEEVVVGISNPDYMQFYLWHMFAQSGSAIGSTMCFQDFGPSSTPTNLLSIRRNNFAISVIDVAGYA